MLSGISIIPGSLLYLIGAPVVLFFSALLSMAGLGAAFFALRANAQWETSLHTSFRVRTAGHRLG